MYICSAATPPGPGAHGMCGANAADAALSMNSPTLNGDRDHDKRSRIRTAPVDRPATPKLAGRVAFVTGGTRGIGAAIAHSLASQGATVAVGYNRNRDSADQFVAEPLAKTRPHGASASAHRGNVGSSGDCRRTIAEVIDQHGRLDILINNAGITIDKTVATMTDDDWHNVLAVNLSGAFFLCQAALAHMVERGSRAHRQRVVRRRRDRQHRPGELRRFEVRTVRADQDTCQRSRLPAGEVRQAHRRRNRHHRQYRHARADHHRDDRRTSRRRSWRS